MTTLFTMTINTGSASQGATQRSETELVSGAMRQVEQKIGSGAAQTGSIFDRNNVSIGTYTYTPVAVK